MLIDFRSWIRAHRISSENDDSTGRAGSDERRLRTILAATSMAMFTVQLDFFALNLALPDMASELDVSVDDLQWVISGYMLALAAFLIPAGRVGDLLGRKRVLLSGLVIFGGASLAGGLAPSADLVIAARVVQGVGGAILFPLAIAVVTNAFAPERQMRAIGNVYGLSALGAALGPFVGGGLTELIDWRAVLFVNVPITLLAGLLVFRSVSESRDDTAPRNIDLPGILFVASGIAALTYAVDRAADWGWLSPDTFGLIAAGLLLIGLFVLRESSARFPLVDLSLFRNRPYVGVTLLGTVANVSFVCATFGATLYLQNVEGYTPAEAGVIFLAASIPLGLAGPFSGRIGERFDIPRSMLAACGFGAAGLLLLSLGPGLAGVLAAFVLYGGGYGFGWSMASVGTQVTVPPERAGIASGVTLAVLIGCGGLAIATLSTLTVVGSGSAAALGSSLESAFLVIGIGSVLAATALVPLAHERSSTEARPE
jgi:EmrB/QacA subfamily drug resistance transporter